MYLKKPELHFSYTQAYFYVSEIAKHLPFVYTSLL